MSMINVMATNIMGAGNYFGNGLTFNARSYGDTILQGNYGIGPMTANINADGNAQILGNYFDQQINPAWFPYAGQPTPQPQYYPQPVPYPVPYAMPYSQPAPQYSAPQQYGGISTYANAAVNSGYQMPSYSMPSYSAPSYSAPSYSAPSYTAPVVYPQAQSYGSSLSSSIAGPGAYGIGTAGYPAYH